MSVVAHERAIGVARCPACKNGKASLRLSKKGLAYLVCNACNAQTFARSERSDEALRALLIPVAPDPAPEPAPAAEPLPPQPEPAPISAPAPPPAAPAPFSWGFLKP